jgi:hypothetical protein
LLFFQGAEIGLREIPQNIRRGFPGGVHTDIPLDFQVDGRAVIMGDGVEKRGGF